MLCYVVIDITGRCQNLLVILSKLSIFHLIVGILITYLTLKKLLPVLCLNCQQLEMGNYSCHECSSLANSWTTLLDIFAHPDSYALFFWIYVHFCHITIRMLYVYRIYVLIVWINMIIIIIIIIIAKSNGDSCLQSCYNQDDRFLHNKEPNDGRNFAQWRT